jgi:hypothetical protein
VDKSKKEIRSELENDVEAFLRAGGKVLKVAAVKVKPKLSARGSQPRYFHTTEPKNRMSNMFSAFGDLNAKKYEAPK